MLSINSLVFNSFQVNTYLVMNENGDCLVIDPAFYSPEEITAFDQYISSAGLNIKGQLNTHCHVDHVLGVKHMQTAYKCPLRAHTNESGLLNNTPLMGEIYGLKVEPLSAIDQAITDNETSRFSNEKMPMVKVTSCTRATMAAMP